MPPVTPKASVIRGRNRAVADTTNRMSDYDRDNMRAYGFIYADGSYSDEREPRGATIVPRRPSPNHFWDPDARDWYEDKASESEVGAARERQFRQTAGTQANGSLLPDRGGVTDQTLATAPSVPTLSTHAEAPSQEAWDRHALKQELEKNANAPQARTDVMPPKTDVYPTHSVAHSAPGVVTSGDSAATFMRPESSQFGQQNPGNPPSIDEVLAANKGLKIEEERPGSTTSGVDAATGVNATTGAEGNVVPQAGASNVARPVAQGTGTPAPLVPGRVEGADVPPKL